MKKKTYEKPTCKVILLQHHTMLLTGSNPVRSVPDGWGWGDPGDDR